MANKTSYPLTPEHLPLVLEWLERKHYRTSQGLRFAYHSGLRYSDLTSITKGDCVVNGVIVERLTVKMQKTSKRHTIAINEDAKKILMDAIAPLEADSDVLFKVSNQHINRVLKKACIVFGIAYQVSTHSLRKSHAQQIYKSSNGDLEIVRLSLGHTSLTSTANYLNTFNDTLSEHVLALSI